MNYKFYYSYEKTDNEKEIDIEANSDREAVNLFYSKVGIASFGCIREDGHFFSDRKVNIEWGITIENGV